MRADQESERTSGAGFSVSLVLPAARRSFPFRALEGHSPETANDERRFEDSEAYGRTELERPAGATLRFDMGRVTCIVMARLASRSYTCAGYSIHDCHRVPPRCTDEASGARMSRSWDGRTASSLHASPVTAPTLCLVYLLMIIPKGGLKNLQGTLDSAASDIGSPLAILELYLSKH